jgi:predicted phosphodiesterase
MRVAIVSDIHGNCLALDAVLADLDRRPVDRLVCLGDAIQGGAQPAETVARLRALGCPVVMGNADAWLLTGEETGAESAPTAAMLATREWSLGQLSEADRAFIAAFPPTVEVSLPDGHRLLCFHGSPASFDDVILPGTPEAEFRRFLAPHAPALLTGGHTHMQQLRRLDDTLYFNPGSVGFAYQHGQSRDDFRADPWAEYAILAAEDGALGVEFRCVPIDIVALMRLVAASEHPDAATVIGRYRPRGVAG